MNRRKLTLIAMSSITAGLLVVTATAVLTSATAAAPPASPGAQTSPVEVALGSAPYNRSIDSIGFSEGPTGLTNVHIGYSMEVGGDGATADLSGEILVQVILDGTVVASGLVLGEFDFLANDAVTCAVSCASPCGSIFGDGVCAGCDCNYNREATLPLAVPAGATVEARLIPFGSPEVLTDDDIKSVVFGDPSDTCPEDLDGDGLVGIGDLLRLLAKWGSCS